MRKQLITLCLLAALSVIAAAENIVIVQGSYLRTGASLQQEFGDVLKIERAASVAALGGTATGWFAVSGDVGVLTSVGVYVPTWTFLTTKCVSGCPSESESVETDHEIEDGGLVLAGDVGAGWKLDLPESPVSFVLGAGVHFTSLTVYPPKDSEADDSGSTVLGLSAQALPMLEVGDGFYLAAGAKLAYHFLLLDSEPDLPDETDYAGGLDFSASVGFGFRF